MADDTSVLEHIRAERARLDLDPGTWPAKRRVADAVRSLMHCLAATDAPEAELLALAAEVDAAAQRFSEQPKMQTLPGVAEMSLAGGMEAFRDRSPLVGLANPLAAPLDLDSDPETMTIHGKVTLGKAFEGAPGCAHGGFVAAIFDEALGMACVFTGGPGMTGWIKVNYRRPTPIETPLRLVARHDEVDGRKIYNSGELYAGDTLVADATGLFISIPATKFSELREAQRQRDADRG